MKRFMIASLLTLLLCMVGAKTFAYDAEINRIYYILSGNEATVTYKDYNDPGFNKTNHYYRGDIIIPKTVEYNGKTYIVTVIGSFAFSGCSDLTSITIPEGVTSIEFCAFADCGSLTSIIIPESVTSINYHAFEGTAWYNNQPDGLIYAGKVAYKYKGTMPNGTNIVIKEGTKSIVSYCFRDCSGLTSITIQGSVSSIGSEAFTGCTSLTKVIIPNIAAWCQANIKSNPLYYAHHLYCDDSTEITNLIIPDSVNTIGNNRFYYCTELTSVLIPNAVKTIGDRAFYNTNLKSVTIGTGVLSIGADVFGYDKTNTGYMPIKVIWLTNTPPTGYKYAAGLMNYVANNQYTQLSGKTVYPFLSSVFEVDGIKYVPVSPSERTCDVIDCAYNKSLPLVNIGETVVNKGISLHVSQIHDYACYGHPDIQALTISHHGNIGNSAFSGCMGLQTTDISNQGHIGQYAFYECDSLQELKISNKGDIGQYAFAKVKGSFDATVNNEGVIGQKAFYQSAGLKKLEIGELVTKIEQSAFQGCTNMETTTIGKGISSIGASAFNDCSQLQGIVIPDSVTTMEQEAFRGCSQMQSVKMGIGVRTINSSTFQGCSSLTDLQIGDSVQTIGNYAFAGCSALSSVRIPQAVKTVNDYAFQGCTSLKEVVMDERTAGSSEEKDLQLGSNDSSPLFADCLLDSVYIGRNISYSTSSKQGYSPFYRNASLRSVFITDKETEISHNEFYGCTKLKNVFIGDGVTSIGDWAFSGCSSLDYFAIGSSVKNIGKEAFSDCTAVTQLMSRAQTPPVCGTQALDDINKWNCTLTVPVGYLSAYQAADQWKEFFFIEEKNLDGIATLKAKDASPDVRVIYDAAGRKLNTLQRGMNVLLMKDGSQRKVLVK